MIPEFNIRTALDDSWIEKFPEDHTSTNYPKALIKRISSTPVNSKSSFAPIHYMTRINVIWYCEKPTEFFNKEEETLGELENIVAGDVKIKNAYMISREHGYDPKLDAHLLNIELMFKHEL